MAGDPTIPNLSTLPPPPDPPSPVAPVRNSHATNLAWLAIGSVAAVLGLTFGTVQTVGVLAHEERTEHATVSDPSVAVLDVASDSGTVEVVGADVDDVEITASISDGLVSTRFTHQVIGDRLQVRVRCVAVITGPWCSADLRIVVPRDLEVQIRSADDRVEVRSLSGRVDARSSTGSVEADALTGQVQLHTSDGAVRGTHLGADSLQADADNGSVRLQFDGSPRSVIAHSDNGSVEIVLPRNEQGYDVDVSSDNGGADNQVRTDSTSDHRVVGTSGNGNVTVRYVE